MIEDGYIPVDILQIGEEDPRGARAAIGTITHIVVHYSATYSDQVVTAADINRWHIDRGFDMIGYHWFIRRDGTVEKGRDENKLGAHVGGQNSGKIGVCWAGGCERATGPNVGVDNRTVSQTKALTKLISELKARYPNAKVVGHNELAATQCPGFTASKWWQAANQPAQDGAYKAWLAELKALVNRAP